MKALIVDDEKIIRQGIVHAIPWARYGFAQPLEARNGLDGLELFKQESPDVVLTDIRMPLMDGIAFTTELRKLNADVKIIFLTGYQDMEYVKAAFRNDAMDYILKPIVVADLERALEKAARLLDERKGLHRLRVEMESKLRQSAPTYLRTLWASLAEGRFHSAAEMEEKLRFWGVDLDFDASYQVLIVTLDEYRATPTRDQELLAFGTENILQELIQNRVQGLAFQLQDANKFVGIVPYNPEDHAGIERLVAEIHTQLRAFLTQDLFVAVGTPCDGLLNLYESFESATSVLLHRFYERYAGPAYEGAASLDRELVRSLLSCLYDQDEGRF
ncbi:MAG TPA: response regulator, partial [Clostridia bacterium]|nr:response regulator [Clostridia bacterium]